MEGWNHRWVDDGRIAKLIDGWTDGWIYAWNNEWMDGFIEALEGLVD